MYLIILSGGVGSRLWPVSRKLHPKPFMKMANGQSILQNTFLRGLHFAPKGIVNVTSQEFLFKIKKEWSELFPAEPCPFEPTYMLEPCGRNTAAAVAMACLWMAKKANENDVMLIMPSDHLVSNQEALNVAVASAKQLALQNKIVTFGITPHSPDTGYGYIECEGTVVKRFTEKPSLEKAKDYVASGKYLWNSGMFCFTAKTMLQEMAVHCPDILEGAKVCFNQSKNNHTSFYIDEKSFKNVREDSIDYAVMEKSDKVSIIPCDMGWSDIGNWEAVSQLFSKDENHNVIVGAAITEKTKHCYIESKHRLIATVGIENLAIIDTPDALLVAHKDNIQDVKKIYNSLATAGHSAHELHTTVHRPWGTYTVLEEGSQFKIKRIEVEPLASLSLQSHQCRSEHWVVIAGNAKVINDDQEILLNIGESTYIPAGHKHRLSNPSATDILIIIEVQTGSYVGEDDILRFEDMYNRVEYV